MRVYLPGTLPALATVLGRSEVGDPPLRGFAVTPALREWYSSGDLEELEYVAMAQAARASLRRLAEDPDAPPRRVVLAVEIPDERVKAVGGSADPAAVEVSGEVPVSLVVRRDGPGRSHAVHRPPTRRRADSGLAGETGRGR